MGRDEVNGFENVLEDVLGDEVVEVHPDPAGLDTLAAAGDLALELVGAFEVDAQQRVEPAPAGGNARSTRRRGPRTPPPPPSSVDDLSPQQATTMMKGKHRIDRLQSPRLNVSQPDAIRGDLCA